jgi:hypothetical protein
MLQLEAVAQIDGIVTLLEAIKDRVAHQAPTGAIKVNSSRKLMHSTALLNFDNEHNHPWIEWPQLSCFGHYFSYF